MSYKNFLFVLIIFFINTIVLTSCEENDRTLGGFKGGIECIKDEHCPDLTWECVEGTCKKMCGIDYQDNDNDNICKPNCSIAVLTCPTKQQVVDCIDKTGVAIPTCSCITGYQDNDNDNVCERDCSNFSVFECPVNKKVVVCDDSNGIPKFTCECEIGYQDKDNDNNCLPDCENTSCGDNEYCDDSSGEAICNCEPGFIDIKDGNGCLDEMVEVPAGNFMMGCSESDTKCDNDEKPFHEVFLNAYKIDKYEVSVEKFRLCVNAQVCKSENFNSSWNYNHDRKLHPMNGVSYQGAIEYCEWVNKRLPTEAEWEKAARGDQGSIYPWGDDSLSCSYATYDDGCGIGTTSPIGSKPNNVSVYGVYDTVGNVWEWVSDYYSSTYYADSPIENPQGPETGTNRTVHGGGWDDEAISIRVSNRYSNSPGSKNIDTGFRCAKSLE